jgi:hypothetical protein
LLVYGLSPFVLLAASLASWRIGQLRRLVLRGGLATVAANAAVFLVFSLNPGGLLEWFAD